MRVFVVPRVLSVVEWVSSFAPPRVVSFAARCFFLSPVVVRDCVVPLLFDVVVFESSPAAPAVVALRPVPSPVRSVPF